MATTPEGTPSTATDVMFVCAYHNLPGISDGEWVEYYTPEGFQRLREDLKSYIEHQLDLFSESYDYADYFSGGEYGNPEDSISDDELPVFRSALAAEDQQTPLPDLHPLDVLQGLRAVMFKRMAGDLADARSAVELFNFVMECAIEAVDSRNPRSYIRVETPKEFGPWFIDRILGSIESLQQTWRHDPYEKFIGQKFEPLKPLLDMLKPIVQSAAWPYNDLSLGRLVLIVDYFKKVVEEDWRS
jgi:hypothetical protein